MKHIHILLAALAAVVVLAFVPDAALACPNCKSGFAESTSQASIGEAYSLTIYMMLVLPAAIVGVITMKIVRSARQNAEQSR